MTLTLYINLSLILLSRGSGVRIPPGSPLIKDSMFSRILFMLKVLKIDLLCKCMVVQ